MLFLFGYGLLQWSDRSGFISFFPNCSLLVLQLGRPGGRVPDQDSRTSASVLEREIDVWAEIANCFLFLLAGVEEDQ